MNPYVKVMYGTTSGANSSLQYKINEVNVSIRKIIELNMKYKAVSTW